MRLKLIKLTQNNKDLKYFEQINNEAFPESERMSFEEIFLFASRTDTDVLGIYDVQNPVGFTVLLKNKECAYVYYLAIDEKFRSNGYGGAALNEIIKRYSKLQIILDFEEIDEAAANNAQRIRRKCFYLKNGFHETGHFTLLNGIRFEVVCVGEDLRKEAFKDLLHILHQYRPEFPDILI